MKKSRWVAIGMLIVVIVAIAALFAVERPELGAPTVIGITQELGKITESESVIQTNVAVKNPNPVSIGLESVEAEVFMNDEKMGEMSSVSSTEIKANQVSILKLSTKIDNHKIRGWWVSHIKNGERTEVRVRMNLILDLGLTKHEYPIEFTNSLTTDILSDFNSIPEGLEGVYLGPVQLKLNSMNSRFGDVTEDETEIITSIVVNISEPIPISLSEYYYEIVMNEVTIGAGRVKANDTLAPNSATTISFITPLQNDKIGEWWVSHLKNGERTAVKLKIQPVVEITGKRYECPPIEWGGEFKTSILSALTEETIFNNFL